MKYLRLVLFFIVIIIIVLSFLIYKNYDAANRDKALELGHDLIQNTINSQQITSKHAIYIGEKLQMTLKNNKNIFIKGYEVKFIKGDLSFPYGDGKANSRLNIYSNKFEKLLTIRLKYDKKQEKFHIIGYTTMQFE